jgi:hypothetical protein
VLLQQRGQQVSLEIEALVQAIQAQTKAIGELVQTNQQVIALLTDVVSRLVDDGELPGDIDLDGNTADDESL